MSAWAVLVAAGRGTRAGLDANKVFYPVEGRSPLSRSLDAIAQTGLYEGIVLVLAKDDFLAYRALAEREGACPLVKSVVAGGKTRQESVFAGLKVIPESVEWVSIHDAARPFAGEALFRATLDAARETGSGVISTDVTDTVKRVEEGRAVETLDRERLRAVQTPQSFRREEILRAHMAARRDAFVCLAWMLWEDLDCCNFIRPFYGSIEGGIRNETNVVYGDVIPRRLFTLRLQSGPLC